MIYGIPSLIEYRTAEQHLRFCAENGFLFFEMNLSFPWFQSDKIDTQSLVRLGNEYGVGYTIHLHDQLNPFDFSPEIREGALRSVDYALTLAEKTRAKRITLHLQYGMYSAVSGKKIYAYEVCSDEYLENVDRMASFCSHRLAGSDVFFCIENTKGFTSYHKKAIELMLGYREFGLTFDVGHNFKAPADDEAFILSHRDRIKHFHIHDVTEKSNHVAFGRGILNITSYLELAKSIPDASVVMEVKEAKALLESMRFCRNKGF